MNVTIAVEVEVTSVDELPPALLDHIEMCMNAILPGSVVSVLAYATSGLLIEVES